MKDTHAAAAGSPAAALTAAAYRDGLAVRGSEEGTLEGCDGYYTGLAANFEQGAANHVTGIY